MKNKSKIICAIYLALSLSSCVSIPPDIEACSPLSDPLDITNDNPQLFCRRVLSGTERTIGGDLSKSRLRTGIIVDFDDWVDFAKWAKRECRKTNNECTGK